MDERTIREQSFHDQRFAEDHGQRPQDPFYVTVRGAKQLLIEKVRSCATESSVGLEIGCGIGDTIEDLLSRRPFTAHGIDISNTAIALARERFASANPSPHLAVMDANNLEYADDSFDFVYGYGVLHHLQLPHAFMELRRVLKPGGRFIFMEPLGTNPIINLYRRATPNDRSPDETPFTLQHFSELRYCFESPELTFFGGTSLGGILLGQWPQVQHGFLAAATRLDKTLLKLPGLWPLAWMVVINATKR